MSINLDIGQNLAWTLIAVALLVAACVCLRNRPLVANVTTTTTKTQVQAP